MLSKNKGFYMAELVLSLSIWVLISLLFVPILIYSNKQSVALQQKSTALHILYEYLQTITVEKFERTGMVISRDKTQYEIIWQDETTIGKREVSILYEDIFGESKKISETIQ